jgi:hypothetical protein
MRSITIVALLSFLCACSKKADQPPSKDDKKKEAATPVKLELSTHHTLTIPAEAKPMEGGKPGQHRYKLASDSILLVDDIDESADGGCAAALQKSWDGVAAAKTDATQQQLVRVDKMEWGDLSGHKASFVDLASRAPSDAASGGDFHPMHTMSVCDGEHMIGVSVMTRTKLSADDDTTFAAVWKSLAL